ncbi:hypothetical protein V6N11_021805 [Hibiscus sabdariffa]|uniref:Uncharacterized protein n=1 Tax=Hibiscus sabdariffa TaxID=183260 RepID=A0ABR2THC2_9ROSI
MYCSYCRHWFSVGLKNQRLGAEHTLPSGVALSTRSFTRPPREWRPIFSPIPTNSSLAVASLLHPHLFLTYPQTLQLNPPKSPNPDPNPQALFGRWIKRLQPVKTKHQ